MALPNGTWWAQVALPGSFGWRLASNDAPLAWHERAPELFPEAVLTEYIDRARGLYRVAAFVDGRLEGALFVGPVDAPPQWSDLRDMVGGPGIAASGPVVCACFGVGVAAIHEALASGKATSVEEIGLRCAPAQCGSCLPELEALRRRNFMPGSFNPMTLTITRTPTEAPSPRMQALARLPVFFALEGRRAVVAGGTAAAAWKAELLSAAGAAVEVYAPEPGVEMLALAADSPRGAVIIHRRDWSEVDIAGAAITVGGCAAEDAARAPRRVRQACRSTSR
jgi:bacterioferritin-associated ferredoxin